MTPLRSRRDGRGEIPRSRTSLPLWSGVITLSILLLGSAAAIGVSAGTYASAPAAAEPEFLNVSATSALSFVPNSFSVMPGASVHLIVTQEADFEHTFTLSSVVNTTLPSSDTDSQMYAFFAAHPPLLNLSLGSTVGARFYDNFTAPSSLGTYEYLCEIHFPDMTGTMTVANSPPSSGSSTTPSALEIVGIGVVVVVVVLAVVAVAWSRSRRRSGSGGNPPPPA